MDLHGIKIGYKHAQCFQACISVYKNIQVYIQWGQILKLLQAWSKRKSSIALIVEVKLFAYSIFRVHKMYNVLKLSI